ncbi:MAG: hypothetical protein ACI4AD_01930, partial [Roseburia sp.]
MSEKMNISDYTFIPRNPNTAREIQEFCMNAGNWMDVKCPPSADFAMAKRDEPSQRIVKYANSIYLTGKNNLGAFFRKYDMENDEEHIIAVDEASPTCGELNFKHVIVGSDEVGTGERFKQIIVTAVAVTPNHMDELIRMNVTDSKQMKKSHLKLVGEVLSGISPQQAWEIFENGDTDIVSEDAFVKFRSRILPNSEYDKFQREENGKDKNDLLGELHAGVLNPLIRACEPDYVVVDDFMETDKNVREEFLVALNMEKKRIFFRTKADAVNMAVSCASVISAYLSEIYMEWLTEKIKKDYGIIGDFEFPANNLAFTEQKKRLTEAGADADEVLAKYSKTTFMSK